VTSDRINYGIVGDVKAQNVAVGPNASIHVPDRVLERELAALLRAIESFDGDPERRAMLELAAREVAEELGRPVADKRRVRARLDEIAKIAGPAGAIAGAVTALASAAQTIL
jgi:hypothetical protein